MESSPKFEWAIAEGPRNVALTITADWDAPATRELAGKRLGEAAQLNRSRLYGNKPWQWWVRGATEVQQHLAEQCGWREQRRLQHLALNVTAGAPSICGGDRLATRAFRPETDSGDLLRINNAAFDWHPDQNNWTTDDLERALAQSWVRFEHILVCEDAGQMTGFCWMKFHQSDVRTGEIFLIAIDPARSHERIGQRLACTALTTMVEEGAERAELWCEADNQPALNLYDRLGFSVVATDVAYAPPQEFEATA